MLRNRYFNWVTGVWLVLVLFAVSASVVPAQKKKDIDRARKLATQGDQAFNKRDYKSAVDKYAEAIVLLPNYPAAHFWKGYSHYHLKEYDQSLIELNSALAQGHKPFEVYQIRYYVNYLLKNYDAAIADAQEAAKLDPSKGFTETALYNLVFGDVNRAKEDYRSSIRYYQKAAEMDVNNGDVHYLIAWNYAKLNDNQQMGLAAMEALKRGTKYLPEANLFIAESFLRARKLDEAADYYERSLTAKPDQPELYNTLSDIYRNQNRFDLAIATVRKGIRLYPQSDDLYTSLAWYYSLADKPQDAILAAQSAIRLAPNKPMAYTNLCRAYNDSGQYQLAVNSCNKALSLNAGDGESHLYLARAYEFMKQEDKALENYRKAVDGLSKYTRENPDYSDGFYLLGNAYFAIQKDNEAIEAYKKCLQLAPRFARARFTLGYTYLEKGNKAAAREQYNALLQIDPVLAEKLKQAIDK